MYTYLWSKSIKFWFLHFICGKEKESEHHHFTFPELVPHSEMYQNDAAAEHYILKSSAFSSKLFANLYYHTAEKSPHGVTDSTDICLVFIN
jgi:hypothetical protein